MCKYPPTPLICHFELVFGSFCGKMTESGLLDVSCGVTRALPYSMFWTDFMHGLLHSAYLSEPPFLGARYPGTPPLCSGVPGYAKSTSSGRQWVGGGVVVDGVRLLRGAALRGW